MRARALWYLGVASAALHEETVPMPQPGEVQVRALFGAISRGTERLIYLGGVPPSEYRRMRAPFMEGEFPFPVKYGYSTIGRVAAGSSALADQLVFCLHPHQDLFNMPADSVFVLPGAVPPLRAVLAANMETALNAVWDGAPGPADRVAIVGGGVVGLLVAYLCARLPAAGVTVIDIAPERAPVAHALGAGFALPEAAAGECDVVFHASGSAAGLALALALAGDEATIVELSWYGEGPVPVPLGQAFHSRRLKLVSSQVGKVAPSHRARWTPARRLKAALALLDAPALDALLAPAVRFEELPEKLPEIFGSASSVVCQPIRYAAANE